MKRWYEQLFENSAMTYDKESFTQGTSGEVDFIEQEIGFDKSKRILDVGCGTGRHAIELARRGYTVVGVDLSATQLDRAREKAATAGVTIEFNQQDARTINVVTAFEVVIMLCEGAFPLMETDEMNFQILQNVARALKDKGKFIFSTLNALFPLFHSTQEFINAGATDARSEDNHFDLLTFREHSTFSATDDLGNQKSVVCNERYYAPSEITWYLKSLNFKKVDIYGCKLGKFSRHDKLTPEDFEMLVIAEK